MKSTIKTAIALALTLIFPDLCAQEAAAPAVQGADQSKVLQGIWEGVEVGREAQGKCTMTITGSSIHFQGGNKDEWYKATFALPTGTEPKQLVGRITECPAPQMIGKSSFSIYKIENETLTLTGHKPGAPDAPKSFEGDANSRTFVFKKSEPEK